MNRLLARLDAFGESDTFTAAASIAFVIGYVAFFVRWAVMS